MNADQIREIELNIEQAKEIVARGNALRRLYGNHDFQNIFLKGYMEQESIRLVHLKADPNMQTPENQAAIIRQMDSIGCITGYLNNVTHQAMLAEKAIEADEETRDELLSGEGE